VSEPAHDRPFSEALRAGSAPCWRAAVEHRFVRQLVDDSLPDPVYAAYLRQDYAFIGNLVSLVGAAVAHAPSMPAKARLSGFLGVLTGPENDYFERSFAALGVPLEDPQAIARGPVTERFGALMETAIRAGDYGGILAVLVPAEWSYLAWARAAADRPRPARFYLAEWIDLHVDPGFADFVGWLRGALDGVGATIDTLGDTAGRARLQQLFRDTMELEAAFYDQAFDLAGR
jgi:thiaminase/transcriptional activator TenA